VGNVQEGDRTKEAEMRRRDSYLGNVGTFQKEFKKGWPGSNEGKGEGNVHLPGRGADKGEGVLGWKAVAEDLLPRERHRYVATPAKYHGE